MINRVRPLMIPAIVLFLAVPGFCDDKAPGETPADKGVAKAPDQDALDKAFAEKMSGATLAGQFSVVGQNDDKPPRTDRYEIESVTKLPERENYWTFVARVKYGQYDVRVPVTLEVLWAGDTPVISLTDLTIPGLGSFTTRLLVYGDRYAGTWQHGEVGGHMWGVIEKSDDSAKKPSEKAAEDSKPQSP